MSGVGPSHGQLVDDVAGRHRRLGPSRRDRQGEQRQRAQQQTDIAQLIHPERISDTPPR